MIAISLNLILGFLLFCALVLGLRLERRLRALRQSHTDFAKAVSELDGAAVRTESSLQALRAGTEMAKGELASRIDQARIACQRLEKLSADAERIASRPLPLSQQMALASADRPPPPLTRALARPEPLPPTAPIQSRPAAEASRSRAKLLDDDLFAAAPPPPRRAEPASAEPVFAEPMFAEPVRAAPEPLMIHADNDPLVGAPRTDRVADDRAAREAFYREVLDRETFTPDPFESGRFAHERRAMLAAVMGGRR